MVTKNEYSGFWGYTDKPTEPPYPCIPKIRCTINNPSKLMEVLKFQELSESKVS